MQGLVIVMTHPPSLAPPGRRDKRRAANEARGENPRELVTHTKKYHAITPREEKGGEVTGKKKE